MMLATVLDDVIDIPRFAPLICGDMELDLALLYSFLQLGDVVRADLFLGEVSGEHLIDIKSPAPVVAA